MNCLVPAYPQHKIFQPYYNRFQTFLQEAIAEKNRFAERKIDKCGNTLYYKIIKCTEADRIRKGDYKMKLKELREKNKLSQAAFAGTLGVSGKSIYLIEAGKMKLSKKLSDKIAEVYGEFIEPAERKTRKTAAKVEKKADKAAAAAAEAVLDAEKKADRRKRRTKAAAQADKPSAEMAGEALADMVEKGAGKARRGRRKVEAAVVEKAAAKLLPKMVIQSPQGGEISPEEIYAKVGQVDAIYVRVDQNKAYWVRGEENGAVDLW